MLAYREVSAHINPSTLLGNLLHGYWKLQFIVDFPIKNCIFHSHISLPEGKHSQPAAFFSAQRSFPAPATPMTQLSPQPRCAHSRAARMTSTFPVPQRSVIRVTTDFDGFWWPQNGGCWIRGIMNSLYIQYIPMGYLMSLIQFDPHRSLSRGLVQGNCHVETAMVFFHQILGHPVKQWEIILNGTPPNDLMPFGGYWCRVDMGWHYPFNLFSEWSRDCASDRGLWLGSKDTLHCPESLFQLQYHNS